MKSGVITVFDHSDKMRKAIDALHNQSVYAGVPEEKAPREGEMNNATLAYIHNFGSPIRNIPARPFLSPGIKSEQNAIAKFLKESAKAALDGNFKGVTRGLNKAGLSAQNGIRKQFQENDWEPLAPATIAKKGAGKDKPLIDTGQLRKSISYVVRKTK